MKHGRRSPSYSNTLERSVAKGSPSARASLSVRSAQPRPCIAVVGAGVSGLSTAIALLERGFHTTLFCDEQRQPPASLVAPAAFTPYPGVANTRLRRWTRDSHAVFSELAQSLGDVTGVRILDLHEYFHGPERLSKAAPWLSELLHARRLPLPPRSPYAWARITTRPHIDTTRYIPWLRDQVLARGGQIVPRRITSLARLAGEGFAAVVNCAGLGSRVLCRDPRMLPLGGQVVHVPRSRLPITHSVHDDSTGANVTYVYLFDDHAVFGSTLIENRRATRPDERTTRGIMARCHALLDLDARIAPSPDSHARDSRATNTRASKNARSTPRVPTHAIASTRAAAYPERALLRTLAGSRPGRTGPTPGYEHVRLELDRSLQSPAPIVHNYGHGRSGITLSWGCALEAADLVSTAVAAQARPTRGASPRPRPAPARS